MCLDYFQINSSMENNDERVQRRIWHYAECGA